MTKSLKHITLFFLLFFCGFHLMSQHHFEFKKGFKKQTMSFKLLSNLIVLPIEVNGKELNFILDSGVGATILFNLNSRDSIPLNNKSTIKLQGLGKEEAVDAILSVGNEMKLDHIISDNQELYVVFNDFFDLSSKLGITIHGIIGFELFKDFVIKIQYGAKRISFYEPESYSYPNCRKCETLNLEFYKLKPYINVGVLLDSVTDKMTNVKLLIDSGGSDAMWLFENSKPEIKAPNNYFHDFLGEGLSGSIYGKRSKIKGLQIGNFHLENPTVSYPDSVSVRHARKFQMRNGSMGASILKRFIVTFDYPGHKITFKKGSAFGAPFRYNMSGIELGYNGKVLVAERDKTTFSLLDGQQATKRDVVVLDYRYKYAFKSSYKIMNIRESSPAFEAGLRKNDILIKINNMYAHEMTLDEIVAYFYKKEGTRLLLVVERLGQHYQYKFKLREMLK